MSEPVNAPAADIILVAEGLSRHFGGFVAVDGVDLSIVRHTIHALIGPNGAGKTTCFNLLTKFIQPSAGRIVFDGRDITRLPPADIARLGLVRSFQISAIFPTLTVLENVRIALQKRDGDWFNFLHSARRLRDYDTRAMALLEEVGLQDFHNISAVDLPYGRKRALELATTLALDPKMLLLDEPMAGIGHEDIDHIMEVIRRIGENRTILMVEHNLSVVSHICDRITVLARGQVLAEGDYEQVSSNPKVVDAYIGGTE